MVQRQDGRPVRYERNDAYFQWRRIDQIRAEYTEQEIVTVLSEALEEIEAYRTQFGAEHPGEVSLVDVTREQNLSIEAAWEALIQWETLERRTALLDVARQNDQVSGSKPRRIDA